MPEPVRIFAVTGEDVARFSLEDREGQAVLRGVGARCVEVDPGDPDRVYVGTFDRGVFISDDAGASWRQDEQGLVDRRVMSLAVSGSHQSDGVSVAYAGIEPSNLYRSSEPSWSFPPRPWTHHVCTIATHPADPDWLADGIELGGVMRSEDAGKRWHDHNPQAYITATHTSC